jgi:hypothetical protein
MGQSKLNHGAQFKLVRTEGFRSEALPKCLSSHDPLVDLRQGNVLFCGGDDHGMEASQYVSGTMAGFFGWRVIEKADSRFSGHSRVW